MALGGVWVSRFGLSPEESAQLLFGATTPQSWWEKPRMAALLSRPRGHRVRPPERGEPHDHRRAINELLAEVSFAAAELGAVARRAAERMADAIARMDEEIAALSRVASRAEIERLDAQTMVLEHGANTASTQALRELLQQQLTVMRAMQAQCETLAQRRARRMELLHGLWAKLERQLDTDALPATLMENEAAIRALCEEMELEAAGAVSGVELPGATSPIPPIPSPFPFPSVHV
jgi:hypothetical protein